MIVRAYSKQRNGIKGARKSQIIHANFGIVK